MDIDYLRDHVMYITDYDVFASIDRDVAALGPALNAADRLDWDEAYLALGQYLRERTSPRFHSRRTVLNDKGASPDRVQRLLDDAEDICNGKITRAEDKAFIHETFDGTVDFTEDRGEGAYSRFATMYWMDGIGLAYAETGDAKYPQTFERIFRGWYAQRARIAGSMLFADNNQDPLWHELETSIRTQIMLSVWEDLRHYPDFSPGFIAEFVKTILASGRWLYALEDETAEAGEWRSNWTFSGCFGCLLAGLFLPEFPETVDWVPLPTHQLQKALVNDHYSDGGHFERAPGYGMICHDIAMDVMSLLRLNEDRWEVPESYVEPMRGIFKWWMNMTSPVGTVPGINDSPTLNKTAFLRRGVKLLDDPILTWPVRQHLPADEMPDGPGPDHTSINLAGSRFAVMRNGWEPNDAYMLINYGGDSSGHTHMDSNSFVIYAHGQLLANDPGCAPGYGNNIHRPWMVASRSHNQVFVDDANMEQCDKAGMIETWAALPHVDFFKATHRGYQRKMGVTSCRAIVFIRDRGCWLIDDRLTQTGAGHTYTWHLNAPAGLQAQDGGRFVSKKSPGLAVIPASGDHGDISTGKQVSDMRDAWEHGNGYPDVDWVNYEKITDDGTGKHAEFGFLIVPYEQDPPKVQLERLDVEGADASAYRLTWDDGCEETVVIRYDAFGDVTGTDFSVEADAAFWRNQSGAVTIAAMAGGTTLVVDGTEIIHSEVCLPEIEVTWAPDSIAVTATRIETLTVAAAGAQAVTLNGHAIDTESTEHGLRMRGDTLWAVPCRRVVPPGEQTLPVQVVNGDATTKGEIVLALPKLDCSARFPVDLGPGESVVVVASFILPENEDPRVTDHAMTIAFDNGTGINTLWSGVLMVTPTLQVDDPLQIKFLPNERHGDTWMQPIDVHYKGQEPFSGEIALTLDGIDVKQSVQTFTDLLPFSNRIFRFRFETDPCQSVHGTFRFDNPHRTIKTPCRIDFPYCRKATSSPIIDGTLDGWNGACQIHLVDGHQVLIGPEEWQGPETLSGSVYTLHDTDHLYFAFDITDPLIIPEPADTLNACAGTGIELYLDLRSVAEMGHGIYDHRVFQLYLIPGNGDTISAHIVGEKRPENAVIASALSERGYILEVALPWQSFPWLDLDTTPVIGFDVALNRRTPDKPRDMQMTWYGDWDNWRDPSRFGRLYLER